MIASLILAIVHIGPVVVFAFICGVFLCWIYEKYQNL
ncbi:MAG: CPBP family intramembrane metalloprotease [Elusimicrobia bacterium]|nr:CPBP family intramembrane metalloprotease [Elusimicrobiota bacterium]